MNGAFKLDATGVPRIWRVNRRYETGFDGEGISGVTNEFGAMAALFRLSATWMIGVSGEAAWIVLIPAAGIVPVLTCFGQKQGCGLGEANSKEEVAAVCTRV